MRAALYLRVSTRKQAQQDLSLPDQSQHLRSYCARKGWSVVREYSERGASATTQERPVFQEMLAEARRRPRPFDVILVHSYSRFARDLLDSEFIIRMLAKLGVQLVSTTQEINDGPHGDMIRRMMSMFDEYSSRENAKHTLRAMKENAKQGFWNGSLPPYGYKIVEAEKRGQKSKRKLVIDQTEAATVREIFKLYLNGDGRTGPLGTKRIVSYLNGKGRRQRAGKTFSIQFVQRALRNTAYIGTHYFNRKDSRTGEKKPRGEWVAMSCPSIVERATFNVAQKLLSERDPKKTPPRTITNGILLGGLVRCGHCNSPMTLRGGKSGRYRYYACNNRVRLGATACKGNVLPMPKLDGLVTNALLDRILAPERVAKLIVEVRKADQRRSGGTAQRMRQVNARERELSSSISNILAAVESGGIKDHGEIGRRLEELESSLAEARREKATLESQTAVAQQAITPRQLSRAINWLGDVLRTGEIQLRKAYLRVFIETVEVNDGEIVITGSREAMARAIAVGSEKPSNTVPFFAQEWRPRRDLNARPPD